jgi:hypothetical protein
MDKHNDETGFERAEYAKFRELRLRRTSPKPVGWDTYEQLRTMVVERLSAFIEQSQSEPDAALLRPLLLEQFSSLLQKERLVLTGAERRALIEDVFNEILSPYPQSDAEKLRKD